jgi:alpha-glucoside transport system substrate-binding protein
MVQALTLLVRLWSEPGLIARNPATMTLQQSVGQVFDTHEAAVVYGGDFLTREIGKIIGGPQLRSEEVDFFNFPAVDEAAPQPLVVGGDIAVMTRNTPGADQLMQFLAGPESARIWAARGGLLSPNRHLGAESYPDAVSWKAAKALQDAEPHFDLSDQLPPQFGSVEGKGLRGALYALLQDPTPNRLKRTTEILERQAKDADSRPAACPKR